MPDGSTHIIEGNRRVAAAMEEGKKAQGIVETAAEYAAREGREFNPAHSVAWPVNQLPMDKKNIALSTFLISETWLKNGLLEEDVLLKDYEKYEKGLLNKRYSMPEVYLYAYLQAKEVLTDHEIDFLHRNCQW